MNLHATRYKVYCLLVGACEDGLQHNLTQVAEALNKSVSTVHKHKEALLDLGIVKRSPGASLLYDRGPQAKYVEERELNPQLNPDGGTVNRPPDPDAVLSRDDTVRAHLNGAVIFPVEKVGDCGFIEYKDSEAPGGVVRVKFLEANPYLKHHNNSFFLGRFNLPGKPWTVTVQLQVTPKKDRFYIWPPEVHLTRQDLDDDGGGQGTQDLDEFYKTDVYAILDFLERWSWWKFERQHGRIIGKRTGQVEYAYSNPVLTRTIPKGIKGVKDTQEVWLDQSPGELEVESYQEKHMRHLLNNADVHEELDEKYNRLKERLLRVYDMLEEIVKVQESEIEMLRMKELKEKMEKAKQKTLDDHRGYE